MASLSKAEVEAELAARQVGAVEAQRRQRHHRRRGPHRGARLGPHMEDVQRPADMLGPVLAAIDEGVLDLQLGDVAHRARHGDTARFGHGLDAFGEVHAVAEQVVVLLVDDDLAQMDADAEHQLLVLVERIVELRHALLDVDRRRDRGQGRIELDQHGIAVAVDHRAAGAFDGRPPRPRCAPA